MVKIVRVRILQTCIHFPGTTSREEQLRHEQNKYDGMFSRIIQFILSDIIS